MKRIVLIPFFLFLLPLFINAEAMDADQAPESALGYYHPETQEGFVSFSAWEPEAPASPVLLADYPQEAIRLINVNRQGGGLLPLKANPILAALAQAHSEQMRNTACMAHQCTGELSPAERVCGSGYRMYGGTHSVKEVNPASSGGFPNPGDGSCFVGEAIAGGYTTPSSVVAGWMASPPHYAILMHRQLREIGVGFAGGGYHRAYWTADLGSQPDSLPVFVNYDAADTATCQVTLNMTNEEVSGFGGIDYAPEVMISNDSSFTGSGWQDYVPNKPWNLTQGVGQKIVYVKYRDSSGAELISCDDIQLR